MHWADQIRTTVPNATPKKNQTGKRRKQRQQSTLQRAVHKLQRAKKP
jgi:hypothetical protein